MKITVVHKAFEDAPQVVAEVEAPHAVVEEALEYAYRWTQNIVGSWSLKIGDDANNNVTVMGDVSSGMGLRSTSMGDQILVGNKKYVVAMMGFETLEGEKI